MNEKTVEKMLAAIASILFNGEKPTVEKALLLGKISNALYTILKEEEKRHEIKRTTTKIQR